MKERMDIFRQLDQHQNFKLNNLSTQNADNDNIMANLRMYSEEWRTKQYAKIPSI